MPGVEGQRGGPWRRVDLISACHPVLGDDRWELRFIPRQRNISCEQAGIALGLPLQQYAISSPCSTSSFLPLLHPIEERDGRGGAFCPEFPSVLSPFVPHG